MAYRTDRIHASLASYYTRAIEAHGATPRGVDWNGADGQLRRFEQFERLYEDGTAFSVIDQGCGYGAYFDYLRERHRDFRYLGLDISDKMISEARARVSSASARFAVATGNSETADFTVASGIFNVRGDEPDEDWLAYILDTVDGMASKSRRGFAFNCLTLHSDREFMRPKLYYADPVQLFDHCRRRYARNVALLHDYGLYEFTILVRLA